MGCFLLFLLSGWTFPRIYAILSTLQSKHTLMKWYKKQMDQLKKLESSKSVEATNASKSVKQVFDPKNLKGSKIFFPNKMEKRSRAKTDSIS